MKRILVPTDFSEASIAAVNAAASLARKGQATVYLVHVFDLPFVGSSAEVMARDWPDAGNLVQKVNEKLDDLINGAELNGVEVETLVGHGSVAGNIVDWVAEKAIELVVVGAHGAGGLTDFLVGSNTDKIVRSVPCPVLTIKAGQQIDSVRNIVFASNFYGEVKVAFPGIQSLADFLGARIHLLKVVTRKDFETTAFSRKLLSSFAEDAGLTNHTINTYNAETLEAGILEFAAESEVDMIAVCTHGFQGLAHLVSGSTAEDVAGEANLPVLTAKIKEVPIEYGVIFPDLSHR